MTDPGSGPDTLPQRLCSEVQLFDLCDLVSCKYKKGRFCSDLVLLSRFEKIAEEDLMSSENYVSENIDDIEVDGGDGDGYDEDDEFSAENLECGENDGCEYEDED